MRSRQRRAADDLGFNTIGLNLRAFVLAGLAANARLIDIGVLRGRAPSVSLLALPSLAARFLSRRGKAYALRMGERHAARGRFMRRVRFGST
jgi:hypothetical protein